MKAVVLETRDRQTAVLVNDGTVRIVRGVYNVGDIIDYRHRPRIVRWVAAAAAMVILVGGSAAMWIDRNYVTYAEVSLDVNPSIVYSLNKRDRVLDVRAVNADAERIVAELEQEGVRFAPLSEAVEKTMTVLDGQGYLDESTDDYVLINVSADDEDRQTRLSGEVETAMTATLEQNCTIEYRIDLSDRKTARDADEAGMSAGRYTAWQRDEGASDVKDYADKPIRELMAQSPDEDQRDSKAKPDAAPADGSQAPPSDASNDRLPSGPMQEEDATVAPSDVRTPVDNPAGDVPSSGQDPADKTVAGVPSYDTQAPMEKPPANVSPGAQGPTSKQSTEASSGGQESQESEKASSPQRESKEAPSSDKNESVPEQNASSNEDNRPSQPDRESRQADRPNKDNKPSSSGGSEKPSHAAEPGPKR